MKQIRSIIRYSVYICCILPMLLISGTVLAQDEPEGLEEVIVTAQKREVSIQDVPVSVFAISEEQLIRAGVLDIKDYAKGVAGLSLADAKGREVDESRLRIEVDAGVQEHGAESVVDALVESPEPG